jgi:sec-independent protein translocase protein TatA
MVVLVLVHLRLLDERLIGRGGQHLERHHESAANLDGPHPEEAEMFYSKPWLDGLIVVLVLLLFFGPKRLPSLGRSLGTGLREFKTSITGESTADVDEHFEIPKAGSAQPVQTQPAPQPAAVPAYQPAPQQAPVAQPTPAPVAPPAPAPDAQPAPAGTPADPAV